MSLWAAPTLVEKRTLGSTKLFFYGVNDTKADEIFLRVVELKTYPSADSTLFTFLLKIGRKERNQIRCPWGLFHKTFCGRN
jgi:hypothetical protein